MDRSIEYQHGVSALSFGIVVSVPRRTVWPTYCPSSPHGFEPSTQCGRASRYTSARLQEDRGAHGRRGENRLDKMGRLRRWTDRGCDAPRRHHSRGAAARGSRWPPSSKSTAGHGLVVVSQESSRGGRLDGCLSRRRRIRGVRVHSASGGASRGAGERTLTCDLISHESIGRVPGLRRAARLFAVPVLVVVSALVTAACNKDTVVYTSVSPDGQHRLEVIYSNAPATVQDMTFFVVSRSDGPRGSAAWFTGRRASASFTWSPEDMEISWRDANTVVVRMRDCRPFESKPDLPHPPVTIVCEEIDAAQGAAP